MATPTTTRDAGATLLQMLRDEGWTDADFKMLMHSESTVLRTMALTNVKSRIENAKIRD